MKKVIWIIISILLIGLIATGIFFLWKKYTHLQDIRSHYGEMVMTDHADIYCLKENKFKKCGSIASHVIIPLKQQKVKSLQSEYFQIQDTEYYVLYKEVEPTKEKLESLPNYIVFNQTVQTKEVTKLYQNNVVAITLNQDMNFDIRYQDSESYYVEFLNQIFAISKEEPIEVYEEQHTEEATATQIPVLYFDDINTWKDTDNWAAQKQKIVEYGYHTITLSDYEKWLNNYIRIADHAILLLSNESAQIDDFIIEPKSDTITWMENNTVSKPEQANIYHIKASTTSEQFEKMLKGENVIIYVPSNQKVAVLNYHFFYDPTIGESCNENICLPTQKFEEQLQYLKNNGYYTLTMQEFRDWMYGNREIPEKSVLLTIDDGAMGTGKHNGNKLIPLLEKYNLHATLFLITGWWNIENYRSPNLDIESHTYDMHTGNLCSNQDRGAQLLCSTNEQVIEDLQKSIAITKSTKAFCFPFYAYNDTAIRQVQEVGFELAFVGGNYKASRQSNKYTIPRYPIYKTITLQQFIQMIS